MSSDGLLHALWSQGPPPGDRAGEWAEHVLAHLEALERVGVMTAEEATLWRERIAVTSHDDGAPIAEDAPDVRALLDELLQELPQGSPPGGPEHLRVNAAFGALSALKILPPDEELDATFARRLGARLGPSDPAPPDRPSPPPRPFADASWAEPVEVIRGPPERHGGLRITAVVIYEDGVGLSWHLLTSEPSPPASRTPWDSPWLTLEDDVGTDYAAGGGGATLLNGSERTWDLNVYAGEAHFAPRPPPEARRLSARYAGQSFTVRGS